MPQQFQSKSHPGSSNIDSKQPSENTSEFKDSSEAKSNFSLFCEAPQEIIEEITHYLSDTDAARLSQVNKPLRNGVYNSIYGEVSHLISDLGNDEIKMSSSKMIFGSFAKLKQSVFKNSEILKKEERAKPTFSRKIYNLTPDISRHPYLIVGATVFGLCINEFIISKIDTTVRGSFGSNTPSAVFVAIVGSYFSMAFGNFLGGKVGKFCANDLHAGENFGEGVAMIRNIVTGEYYQVKSIINNFGYPADVSNNIIGKVKYSFAGVMLASVFGLYANQKYYKSMDKRTTALKKEAQQELNNANSELKSFTRRP